MDPIQALAAVTKAVAEARYQLGDNFTWQAWPQVWGDTSCGFGGMAGQAFTEAMTVVAEDTEGRVAVFHAGRLAYILKDFDCQKYQEAVTNRRLPGRSDGWTKQLGVKK